MAFNIEEFCRTPLTDRIYGARALHQLSTYVKAIALRDDTNHVTKTQYSTFQRLSQYFNYDCSLMLPSHAVETDGGDSQ